MVCQVIHCKQRSFYVFRFRCVSLLFLAALLLAWPGNAAAQTAHFSYAQLTLGGSITTPAGVAANGGGSTDFGTVAIGTASSPISLTFTFDSGGTIGSPAALTVGAPDMDFAIASGGSCVLNASFFASDTCTLDVTFTPKYAGLRYGAAILTDGSGNTIATAYVHGIGSGPQMGFQALTAPIASLSNLDITTDKGIAIDGNGNLFVSSVNSTTTKESVVEVPTGCKQASCLKQLPGTFYAVWGLAVDGAGNLWVGDLGASGSITEIPAASGYTTLKTYSGSFGNQIGVAIDGGGNVYFISSRPDYADSVMKLTAASGYTAVQTLATDINVPGGVAVDGSGDVFYIDSWVAGIEEIVAVNGSIPASPTISTVGAGLKGPQYLVVDGSGNLIVTANGGLIYDVLADGGYTTVNTYSNQLSGPTGIAVDGGGNLYVSDLQAGSIVGGLNVPSSAIVYEIACGSAPSLTFPSPTAPGETDTADGAQKVSVQNLGNQPLALAGLTTSSANFTLDKATTTCTATTTLAAGDGCTLGVLFTPTATGNPISGTLTLTDNSHNGAAVQQSLTLSGSSLYTPTIAVSANSWLIAVTQALTMTITINGGGGNPAPTGSVQVNATGYNGSPVTLSNGSATVTIPAGSLPLGQDSFTIQYQPDTASATIYVPVQGNGAVTVTQTLMNVPSITVTPAVESISVGQALTVAVTVNQANGAPVPTGTVTLASGNYSAPTAALVGGAVSFTIPAHSLIVGTDLLVANYTPDATSSTIYVSARGEGFVSVSAAPSPAGAAAVDFGSLVIGNISAVTPVTLTFPANATPASLIATTQGAPGLDFAIVSGGSCGAGVNVTTGQSCTVNVTFTPGFAGVRNGAVLALDAIGETLAMTYVHGYGTGPQIVIQSDPYNFFYGPLQTNYPLTTVALSDGFSRPMVAVDGAGNVFVASFGTGELQEIPAGCASASCVVTVMTGIMAPTAVAVDGAGNLFVTEAVFGDVKKIPLGCNSPSCMETVGTGFNHPYGLMVDSSGNIYVADTYNNAIKEVVAAGGYSVINTLATGLDLPWSVVVDTAGDLFVAEGGDQCQAWIPGSCWNINTSLLEIPAAGGYQTVNTLAGGIFGKPFGLAIDGSGNVYEADYGDSCATEYTAASGYTAARRLCTTYFILDPESIALENNGDIILDDVLNGSVYMMDYADLPSINFKTATLKGEADLQDGAKVLSVQNNGNTPLTFSALTFSNPSFHFDSAVSTCSISTPVPVGGSCYLGVDFAPLVTGPISATLTVTDDNLNQSPATQVIQITAVAMPPAPVILTYPAGATTANSATITFSDTQTPVTFVCSIDSLAFVACGSPMNYSALSGGAHAFQVKAVDAQGNLSPAAAYNWTVTTVGPPAPAITSGPGPKTGAGTAAFSFTDTQAGVTFVCSLDGATYAPCSSGVSYSGLGLTAQPGYLNDAWHSFAVEAQDGADNLSPAATYTWLVSTWGLDGSPVDFGTLPVGQTSAAQPVTFTFTASDTIATIDATTLGITGLDFAVSDPGTCAVGTAVTNNSTCTLQATFTPKFSGQRKGGVVLLDASGDGVGEAYLEGAGTAPQVIFTPYSTVMFDVLPPQNNADPGKDLETWITDAAVDGAGDVYVTEGFMGSVDQSVAVNVGAIWEFPAGCTTAACINLVSTEEGASGKQSTSAALLIPDGLVIDGTGLLWGTNWGLAPFELSTVGSWTSTQCFSPFFTEQLYANRPGVDGAGICSFLANGMLYVAVSQVGVAGSALVAQETSSGTKDKPEAIGGGGNTLSFDFSATTPSMTVDPQSNIFVADAGNNAVKEVLASSNYTIDRTVGSGFNNPTGVASDANGNIFVADTGNNALKEMTAASGYTQILTIATLDPKSVALAELTVDALGNIYLPTSAIGVTNQLEELDFSDPPALTFPSATRIGTTDTMDGTLTVTVENNGNAPLIIGGLAVSNVNFLIDAGATTCSAAAPLAVGASCTVGVIFTPTTPGALTGTLILTDNALNVTGATQQFALSGTGYTTPTTTTPAVTVTPTSASITTAQSDQVTVTVGGASGKPAPTGAVSLFGGNYTSASVQLSGGIAPFTVPAGILALGSNTLNAVYTPDAASSTTYGPGGASATIAVTAVPKSTPTVNVTPSLIDISTLQSLPVTITVSGGDGNPTPTGSVTLSGGNYASLAATLTAGGATITIPAGYLPAGSVTLSAYYTPDFAGSANYNSASGSAQAAVEAAAQITPVVTVTPAYASVYTTQALPVTLQVQGGSGSPAPTGRVVLSSGSYTSAAAAISNGSVILSLPAGTLSVGSNTLDASYTPDTASALTYTAASGSGAVSGTAAITTGNFGTIPVGQTSAPILMALTLSGSGSIGSVTVMMQGAPALDFAIVSGGSCTASKSYGDGDICTASVTFKPRIPGLRYGTVMIKDGFGNVVASDPVNGIGEGPQVRLVPYYPRISPPWPTMGGGISPANLAVDGIGDVFIVDTGQSKANILTAKEIPAGCTSASCVVTLAPNATLVGAITKGESIALDPQGNVFVATSHGGIYEITVASGYQNATLLPNTGSLVGCYGLAVDQSGNVFVTAGSNGGTQNGIFELPAAGGYSTIQQVASGLSNPVGIAVDMNANLFTSSGQQMYEVPAAGGYTTYTAVGSGFSYPGSLTVDQSGNVIALDGSLRGFDELLVSSGYSTADSLFDAFSCAAVAVDAIGNLYCTDGSGIDKLEFADAYVNYPTPTLVGSTDTTDLPRWVTVQNIGNAPLNLTGITPPEANFSIDSGTTTCSTSSALAPGASCVVGVDFKPAGTGSLTGTLTLTDNALNATEATQPVYLAGTGAGVVQATVSTSPAGLSFSVDGTTYTSPQSVTWTIGTSHTIATTSPQTSGGTQNTFASWSDEGAISHAVTASANTTSYTATFATSYQLTTAANPPTGGTVLPVSGAFYASGTVVNLSAAPSSVYTFANWTGNVANAGSAATTVTMNAPQSVTANFSVAPTVTLTSASLSFSAATGTTSATQTVTLTNSSEVPAVMMVSNVIGITPLQISGIGITGANATDFSQTNNCGGSLAAGSSCSISVAFTPASAGTFGATLTIADNASNSPQTVSLSGTGTAPAAVLAPASSGSGSLSTLNFSMVSGATSTPQTATLSSNGSMPLVISGITIAGANPGDFSQTNNCSASLAVGASCSISVTFAPVSVGNFTATLLVTDNAPGSPQSLSLSGSETAVVTVTPDFTISASPGSEAMPSGMTANYMVTVGETGGFGGSVSLAVTGLPSGATASFSPSVVTPGAGGATSMLTVQTGASAAVARSRTRGWLLAMPMLGVVLLVPSRRRQWVSRTLMVLVCLISLGIVAAMTGCGGGFALPKNSPSYTLTITGSSGSTSHSTTVQLTVK